MTDRNPSPSASAVTDRLSRARSDAADDRLRQTEQDGLELNPADAEDEGANADVDALAIEASSLFQQALEQTRMAIAISDPHQPDNPLIYVNRAFVELTGYERDEVVGRNCRFLQGPGTDPEHISALLEALEAQEVRVVELLNYRKDGSTFWNSLHVGPVYNDTGELTHFYGSQWDVTDLVRDRERIAMQDDVAEELRHRTRNLFGVMGSIARLSGRGETDVGVVIGKIEARIRALGHAHEASIDAAGRSGTADLHDLVSTILRPYRTDRKRRVVISGEMVEVPRESVTPLGLMLHELATNALKHGAFSAAEGTVTIEWRHEDDALRLTWMEEGGPSVGEPSASTGTGSRIMDGVLRTIGAELSYEWPPGGLSATLRMPLPNQKGAIGQR